MSVPESICLDPTWFAQLDIGDLFFDTEDELFIKVKALRTTANRDEVDNCVKIGRADSGTLYYAHPEEFVREVSHLYIEPETEEERDADVLGTALVNLDLDDWDRNDDEIAEEQSHS